MVDQRALVDRPVVRCQRAALARRDDLEIVEAVRARVPDGAERPAVVRTAVRLARVLETVQVMLLRQRHNAVHIAGKALDMHRDNRLGVRRNLPFRVRHVDGHGSVALADYRDRARFQHRQRRRDVRISRHDDLVARTDAHSSQCGGQRAVSGRHEQRICRARIRLPFLLEMVHLSPCAVYLEKVVAVDRSRHRFDFFFADSIHDCLLIVRWIVSKERGTVAFVKMEEIRDFSQLPQNFYEGIDDGISSVQVRLLTNFAPSPLTLVSDPTGIVCERLTEFSLLNSVIRTLHG